jgi:hypothetical protein
MMSFVGEQRRILGGNYADNFAANSMNLLHFV